MLCTLSILHTESCRRRRESWFCWEGAALQTPSVTLINGSAVFASVWLCFLHCVVSHCPANKQCVVGERWLVICTCTLNTLSFSVGTEKRNPSSADEQPQNSIHHMWVRAQQTISRDSNCTMNIFHCNTDLVDVRYTLALHSCLHQRLREEAWIKKKGGIDCFRIDQAQQLSELVSPETPGCH